MAVLEALLLCDAATRDTQSGKWTLAGVFDALWSGGLPVVHPSLDVYVRLRAAAPASLRLLLRAPAGGRSLLGTMEARPSARGLVEGAIRVQGMRFDVAGDYRIELEVDGRVLGDTTLTVAELPAPSSTVH